MADYVSKNQFVYNLGLLFFKKNKVIENETYKFVFLIFPFSIFC